MEQNIHVCTDHVNRLRDSTDQTSLAIRFQPDAIGCIGKVPRSFFIEAKAGRHIEKTAWEQYKKLTEAGNVMVLVFENWRWNFISRIGLIPGEETVSSFSPEHRFPVKDGWITPRGSRRWAQVRSGSPQASGTPYQEVDSRSLLEWDVFKQEIIDKLATT